MCVYNVTSFQRLRSAVGPIIHANLDPSHFFFQGMDPLAVIRALGDAIGMSTPRTRASTPKIWRCKDRSIYSPENRFATLCGPTEPWATAMACNSGADFASALRSVGYDGVLSIEHEDPLMDAEEAIARAVDLLKNTALFGPPSIVPGAPPPY